MVTIEEVKKKTPERFLSKIKFGEPNDCWEWRGWLNNKGYGQTSSATYPFFNQKLAYTHRMMYYLIFGEFDLKMKVLHQCDNGACCNPNHLLIGTQRDNMLDMIRKGRANGGMRPGATRINMKLSVEKVMQIKKRLLNNETIKSIAQDFNVDVCSIDAIKAGRNWRHVII